MSRRKIVALKNVLLVSIARAAYLPRREQAGNDGHEDCHRKKGRIAALKSVDGAVGEQWDGSDLSRLPTSSIANEFDYNRFAPGPFGLRAQMRAMATITLPATNAPKIGGIRGAATLELRTVNGNTFNVAVRPG
jgi:thiosulfate dehydrogenase (quinone)